MHRKSAAARLQRTQLQARQGLVETAKAQASRSRGLLRAHGIQVGPVAAGQFVARLQQLIAERAPALRPLVAPLWRLYQQARRAAQAVAQAVTRQVRQDPVCQRLMPVPGGGPLVASTYVATLDDPRRFARSTQVAA